MSRPSNSNNRKSLIYTSRSTLIGTNNTLDEELDYNLRQTLELEKLEQEITLTLQDIDRNLGRSNKIINDSLIPVIQEYSKNSKKLWTGVKFWKNFFEDSANVQFSGVEETQRNGNNEQAESLSEGPLANYENDDEFTNTEGQSIINRYYNEVNQQQQPNHGNENESSTIIKSTPKRQKQAVQAPSSPPLLADTEQQSTTSSIFHNHRNNDQEINFHELYKITLTPNKRPKTVSTHKKSIFDDSPELVPPKLTSLSPLKSSSKQNQVPVDEQDSLQLTTSPPRTLQFAKSQSQQSQKNTPSRVILQSKTNDLKDIIGANDSSSLQQIPPQFSILPKGGNKENQLSNDYELDSILDNKYRDFNKTNDIDWSDDDDNNNSNRV